MAGNYKICLLSIALARKQNYKARSEPKLADGELAVLMEKFREAKNLRQLHLDLNKPEKELTQIQLDIVEIGSSDVVLTTEELCQISTSLSVTVRPTEEEDVPAGDLLSQIDFGRLTNTRLKHVSLNDIHDWVWL
ncbi:hypothetical protein quinque_012705 [Culex quinquefasciatus]